jgi:hypothetical protein
MYSHCSYYAVSLVHRRRIFFWFICVAHMFFASRLMNTVLTPSPQVPVSVANNNMTEVVSALRLCLALEAELDRSASEHKVWMNVVCSIFLLMVYWYILCMGNSSVVWYRVVSHLHLVHILRLRYKTQLVILQHLHGYSNVTTRRTFMHTERMNCCVHRKRPKNNDISILTLY